MKQVTPKKIIILVILAIACIALGWLIQDYLSYKTIQIVLSPQTQSVSIYTKPEGETKAVQLVKLDKTGSARLKQGTYSVTPAGEAVDHSPIDIHITDDTRKVSVDPHFSEARLITLLSTEQGSVDTAIRSSYPALLSDYTVRNSRLHHFGEWFTAVVFLKNPIGRDGVDSYGIILKKEGSTWVFVGKPSLVFSTKDNPTIPRDILDSINRSIVYL